MDEKLSASKLRPAPAMGFALYGGTAIALRLGHRQSVDFDFFQPRHWPCSTLA
ncbi:nucleotidyl transferase AbiEii/AbiGii toxin family protein [Extensimonas sp. H3M7-6]|uniref:nucleotidyl transferase AbiEii/AbiGii toxin family protein n=1 Tax=Extensimonas soli TaxID=3031322 RepID=UPI0023DA0972|nr:nucleotidyl transferase AbiEii/AbiGii toxin family protein [Extensimonas sp. H3M7-6]MDF1482816.1 nucleotidyl transferase AbiEii/AbiGii toxin family protein [Extensimonas sp. H3M7-6]